MVWLDTKRVFAYAANGKASILSGDRLDAIDKQFSVPHADTVTRAVLRDDGRVVVITSDGLVLVDPKNGEAEQTGLDATAVTTDGAYAVNLTTGDGQKDSTTVKIIDVASRQTIEKPIEGTILSFVEHTGGMLALLRQVGAGRGDTDVLMLDPRDGVTRSVKPLGDLSALTSQDVVSSTDAVFADEAVEIGLYSLRSDLRLNLIPTESGHRAFNAIGLNRDGTTLVVASQASQTVSRVPVTPAAWSTLACKVAGRQLHPDELGRIAESTAGLIVGCR
jgi:hypothetical protein